jgi:type II secretory pathway pseudopilin PulG
MTLTKLWYQLRAKRQGYTIDQTILIVAIIAILITLIITTIGWTLLTRTTGNKLASYMTQMDTAINSFYNDNRRFPTTTDGIAAFQTAGLTKFRQVVTGTVTSFRHEIGGPNGTVRLINPATSTAAIPGGGVATDQPHIVIEFTGIPLAEANQADMSMDGVASNSAGRVYTSNDTTCDATGAITPVATAAGATTVTVCYVAQRVS